MQNIIQMNDFKTKKWQIFVLFLRRKSIIFKHYYKTDIIIE